MKLTLHFYDELKEDYIIENIFPEHLFKFNKAIQVAEELRYFLELHLKSKEQLNDLVALLHFSFNIRHPLYPKHQVQVRFFSSFYLSFYK
jgi:ferritin-like metal-binding protein YciE